MARSGIKPLSSSFFRDLLLFWVLLSTSGITPVDAGSQSPAPDDVLSAMKKATRFMVEKVSRHGGYLSLYTEDLSEGWGELPARDSMIWVQDPGTAGMGRTFLKTFIATGDPIFLDAAEKAANALILGQHPSGGWHYFIDFDPQGIEEWYEKVGSKAWGWEEFYHYYGNCTFDDNVTTGAADFLLDLYTTTLEPEYREPLLKVISFILESQYPIGGWPQRYPLRHDHPNQNGPDYTSFLTFNDGVTVNNIFFLWKVWERFGREDCRKAALRGMYFVVISQYGNPQAGWSQAFDLDLNPAGARTYEPKGLTVGTTVANIQHLLTFFKMTGDRRFLRGIPDALEWLESCRLPEGHSQNGATHPEFVELGTNLPLYAHREGTSVEDGRYWVDHDPHNFPGHYGMQTKVDLDALRKEYDRVRRLTQKQAKREYESTRSGTGGKLVPSAETAWHLLDSMNDQGAWIEDLSVPDYTDWKFKPRRHFHGISTATFMKNLSLLLEYWKHNSPNSG